MIGECNGYSGTKNEEDMCFGSHSTSGPWFDDEECLAAAVTTTTRERAVALSGAFVEGGLPQVSYASPWAVMTLKHDSITHTTGRVSKAILVELARGIEGYVTPGSDTDSAGDE